MKKTQTSANKFPQPGHEPDDIEKDIAAMGKQLDFLEDYELISDEKLRKLRSAVNERQVEQSRTNE